MQLIIVLVSGVFAWLVLSTTMTRNTEGAETAVMQLVAGVVALLFMLTWPSLVYSILHSH